MTSYHQFAYIYDQLMRDAPYDRWVQFTCEMFKRNNASKIVDLGCGTGEIAIRLAKLGYHITGVDLSSDMLSVALEKSEREKATVQWIQQDIRKLEGFQDVDLFISFCDVINYITDLDDVSSVFEHVYHSLSSNGMFIFDIHSIYYVENKLIHHTFTDISDDLTYIWACEEGEMRGEMFHFLTFFQRSQNKYVRIDEVHHQQTYEVQVYEQLLKSCGFTNIKFYGDFMIQNSFSEKKCERILFVAQK